MVLPSQDCPGESGEGETPVGEEEPSSEVESELSKHLLQFHNREINLLIILHECAPSLKQ